MSKARRKGSSFERLIADYLAQRLNDDRIDRAPLRGTKDRGDISGVRSPFGKVVLECKNVARLALAAWVEEAQIEKVNADAIAGFVVVKRVGKGAPGEQYVIGRLDDLIAVLGGPQADG